jgi:hypothetical protein
MGLVASTGEIRRVYEILVGKPEGKNLLEDLGVYKSIILKWALKNVVKIWRTH